MVFQVVFQVVFGVVFFGHDERSCVCGWGADTKHFQILYMSQAAVEDDTCQLQMGWTRV